MGYMSYLILISKLDEVIDCFTNGYPLNSQLPLQLLNLFMHRELL